MPIRWLGHKVSPHVFNFIWNTCYFIWNHLTNEMILTALPLHRRSGWWVGGGASTHLVFTGTSYLFVHISYENTHQHFAFFYIHFISYEIHAFDFIWNMYTFGWLVHTVSQALLFFWTFHLKFYFNLKLSYLNLSVWTDTTIFCFGLSVRCVDVLVVLCRKAFAVCSGEDSRLFLGHDNSLVFSSVVFVWFLCWFEVDWHQF